MSDFDPLRIALIVGSTRADRFADLPARWLLDATALRSDVAFDVVDLRDHPLPFFGEPDPSGGAAGAAWRARVGAFDAYVITAAEYNHGPTAVLKNALDWAMGPLADKPVAFVGYGGVGGARAVEQLRQIAIELQMAPVKTAVHIGGDVFLAVRQGAPLDAYPHLAEARTVMLDQLVAWAAAFRAARETRETRATREPALAA